MNMNNSNNKRKEKNMQYHVQEKKRNSKSEIQYCTDCMYLIIVGREKLYPYLKCEKQRILHHRGFADCKDYKCKLAEITGHK